MPKKKIFAGVALIIILGLTCYIFVSRSKSFQVLFIDESGYRSNFENGHLVFVSPDGEKIVPSEALLPHLRGPEWLSSLVMPVVDGQVILSTDEIIAGQFSGEAGPCTSINRLYRYQRETGQLETLYEEKSVSGSPAISTKCRIHRTVGRQENNIILLIDDPDNSPGICTNIWSSYHDRLVLFNISDPSQGLRPFTVPKDKIDSGKEEEQRCLENVR